MRIKFGYELIYQCPRPTPMILMLNAHFSRASDIITPDHMHADPGVSVVPFRDIFGNWCSRIIAPQGQMRLHAEGLINDSGLPDPISPDAQEHPVEALPDECLMFLLPTRYCDSDRLLETAWSLFKDVPPGWTRVQAICDYVHRHITFSYNHARLTRTAWDAHNEKIGVCRDFAHLAIAFCRAMNIPARYCTGYLGDIGMPPPYAVGDFAAWIEVYIGNRWHLFDPRNNVPRIGRVLIARGRDAVDVAIATTFGPNILEKFTVWTDEVQNELPAA